MSSDDDEEMVAAEADIDIAMEQARADTLSFAADALDNEDEARELYDVVASGAPQSVGPLAATTRLVGLTMRVPNPAFIVARERYADLVRQLQVQRRVLDAARTWITEAERLPAYGCFTVPRLLDTYELTEIDVASVLDGATYVTKPSIVRERRNGEIRALLNGELRRDDALAATLVREEKFKRVRARLTTDAERAAFDANPAGYVGLAALLVAADEQAIEQQVAGIVDAVRARFANAVELFDWSDTPLTRDELQVLFVASLDDERARRTAASAATAARAPEPLPFSADADADYEREYRRLTVAAAPVTSMLVWFRDDWAGVAGYDAATDSYTGAGADPIIAEMYFDTKQRVYGTANALVGDAPLVDVGTRDANLRTDTQLAADFREAVLATLRLEALIAGIGTRPPDLTDADVAELRALQAARLASIDPSEESLRTRRFRLIEVARGVRLEAEVHAERLRYELDKEPPVIDAPLVVERSVFSADDLRLSVRTEPPTAAPYFFTWYRRAHNAPDGTAQVVNYGRLENTPRSSTLVLPASRDLSGSYYARAARATGAARVTFLYSTEASVRVFAECTRCDGARFEVGEGIERVFGECVWRAHPLTQATLEFRDRDDFSPITARLGLASVRSGYRAELDDSVANLANGTLLLDDQSVVNLSLLPKDTLRKRYFTLEAVVGNIAQRYYRRNAGAQAFVQTLADRVEAVARAASPVLANLGLTSAAVERLVVGRTRAAATLDDVPLLALLAVTLDDDDDDDDTLIVVRESERRYFGTLAIHFTAFARLYRVVALFDEPGEARTVDAELAALTADGVRGSYVWSSDVRQRYVLGTVTPFSMFVDDVGEARLQQRIAEALRRYDYETGEARFAERAFSSSKTIMDRRLDTYDSLGQPIGVPLAVWHEMQLAQMQAAEAERRLTSAPLHRADWRGVHSATDTQPTPYSLAERGSERLRAGYDFEGIHELIERARADGDIARAEQLILYFNTLAQFAPTLHLGESRMVSKNNGLALQTELPAAALVARLDESLGVGK